MATAGQRRRNYARFARQAAAEEAREQWRLMTPEQREEAKRIEAEEKKARDARWEAWSQEVNGCSYEEYNRRENEKRKKKEAAKKALDERYTSLVRGEIEVTLESMLKRDPAYFKVIDTYLTSLGLVSKYSTADYPTANTFDVMKIVAIRKNVLSRKTTAGHISLEEGVEQVKAFLKTKGVEV